uniref:Uncharacterized conserved protein, DUF488 family n=1 Tax=Candidatus Kentrum sp. LPFa TaxID=2126335 RepID=A0A450WPX4_9GAMM|nr:MAG: Uncharacterized conserved protein, DUF488 family [Candidatus Kentron sp. LPFa]
MHARQRVLLSFPVRAGYHPGRTELIKWLFLARHEGDIANLIAFYDFLPYRYGPFSFAAYKDLAVLVEKGYLTGKTLAVPAEARREVETEIAGLPRAVRHSVSSILLKYGNLDRKELLDIVYKGYPWYASRSTLIPHGSTQYTANISIHTLGYEGRSIDAFLNRVLQKGIARIIDVRRNPLSRKYGFTRRALDNLCGKIGIEYVHFPQVGVPSDLRRDLSSKDAYHALLRHYEKEILPRQENTVAEIGALMKDSPSALLCFEEDHAICHRSVLAKAVASQTGLGVIHL